MIDDSFYKKTIQQEESVYDEALLKQKMVATFQAFDAFCRKHDLKYTVAYGTMLGAVRHRGLIPWDDDIDVMMPRPDYNRFIELTLKGMAPGYNVLSVYNCKTYYLTWAKVIDANTTLIELKHLSECPTGAFIDVFPCDGIPRDAKEMKKNERLFYKHQNRVCVLFNKGIHSWKSKLRYLVYKILFNQQKELLKADQIAQSTPFESARYVQFYGEANGLNAAFDKSVFDHYIELPFENSTCKSLAKTEYCLTKQYGDYMQLPPEENRISHHYHYFVDMNRHWTMEELKSKGII